MIVTLIISVILPAALSSCGSVRTHWGVEGDYELPFGDDDYYRPKHKKHRKHKKHKKHHHDDCDYAPVYHSEDEMEIPL